MLSKKSRISNACKVPNSFILDTQLSYSTKRVGAAIFSRRNKYNMCCISIAQIASLALCCPSTALQAVRELERYGYLKRNHKKGYSNDLKMVVHKKSEYMIASFGGGFTFVQRSVFKKNIRNSSFTVYMYLRYRAGNDERAFPSLNMICDDLYICKSAVCKALHELSDSGMICRLPCKRNGNRDFCNNSYYFAIETISTRTHQPGFSRNSTRRLVLHSRTSARLAKPCKSTALQRIQRRRFTVPIVQRRKLLFKGGG